MILLSAFAIVRHAESPAMILGEPFGTLTPTLSVTGLVTDRTIHLGLDAVNTILLLP